LPGCASPSPRGGSRLSRTNNNNNINTNYGGSSSVTSSGGGDDGAALGAAAAAADGSVGVEVVGLALLHPNLSGHQVPPFTRLLASSSLGRSMLRPLLRSEVSVPTV
jgi:hypothetical protein